MVQVQSENECVLGGATSEALPLPGLGPFKLPPLPLSFCHSPSARPPPSDTVFISPSLRCRRRRCCRLRHPGPRLLHRPGGPDSSFRDPVPATANMSSEKSGKKRFQ